MEEKQVVSKINEYLHAATKELVEWLKKMLPRVTDNWWQECVMDNLSYAQKQFALEKNYTQLDQFDLAALLRITDKSWYDMRAFAYLPTTERECVRAMMKVRNNWAHCAGSLPEKDIVLGDLKTILDFFETVIITNTYTEDLTVLICAVSTADFSSLHKAVQEPTSATESSAPAVSSPVEPVSDDEKIHEKDRVYLTSDPDTKGMVFSVSEIGGTTKYEVFVDGDIKTFFDGQIRKIDSAPTYHWVDLETFQTSLTAYEINNPSAGNLYSLNSARIDFVPYQFRPALKLIKADEPKILIADSVGVGKTIEAGLIIKELEARNDLDNILIICPKPLVAERKWELEMNRFDEEFTPLDSLSLRQILSDTHRDEEWPSRFNKAIIPYSILDSRVYEGDSRKGGKRYGLLDLDPPPHFDLVIIDEAHHIRNGSLEKEKAFAYKCVRYFCEHADAVVMLTATPLQTSDDDLYTLLNLLRPDVVMDKEVFQLMTKPNEFIYRASHAVRSGAEQWQDEATKALEEVRSTHWGESVIAKDPLYQEILARLKARPILREEKVKLISDIESLHSFNFMLNRTRRRDIQDFCIRRSYTIETHFTPAQQQLHDKLLEFEYSALSQMHSTRSVLFMMSTIRRQAASCVFGLAPYIRDIVSRRFEQLTDDPDIDLDEIVFDGSSANALKVLAQNILELADHLPEEDPKFDSVLKIIDEKQQEENNKIILFSTFRHTLAYVYSKLIKHNYRVAQIDGSVKDEDRRILRERFELNKDDPHALDILLFTEVGSEGLDYQFCDTMINYDLPWNPMRIEQRIGRIDRHGQVSEAVNIYNLITEGTVDADIYYRCLMRIGIFERSIGECEEVLGAIGAQIEQIAINTKLTPEERRIKLEQMADNEIRHLQELNRLEEEEKSLFGFDLSNYITTKEIKNAESPWLSPASIQHLVVRYLSARLGEGQYIIGNTDMKQLRLGKSSRLALLDDFRKLSNVRSALKRKWENYLKGNEPMHALTFAAESASKDRKAFFITPMHPLVKQAARFFASSDITHIHLLHYTDDIPAGLYPFSIYAWSYVGLVPMFRVVPICENEILNDELIDIIQNDETSTDKISVKQNTWSSLEGKHIRLWQDEKTKFIENVNNTANYKLESLGSNFRNRKRTLEQKIRDSFDEKIVRMYESELNSATENYNNKVESIHERTSRADIHTSLVANGLIEIRRG